MYVSLFSLTGLLKIPLLLHNDIFHMGELPMQSNRITISTPLLYIKRVTTESGYARGILIRVHFVPIKNQTNYECVICMWIITRLRQTAAMVSRVVAGRCHMRTWETVLLLKLLCYQGWLRAANTVVSWLLRNPPYLVLSQPHFACGKLNP